MCCMHCRLCNLNMMDLRYSMCHLGILYIGTLIRSTTKRSTQDSWWQLSRHHYKTHKYHHHPTLTQESWCRAGRKAPRRVCSSFARHRTVGGSGAWARVRPIRACSCRAGRSHWKNSSQRCTSPGSSWRWFRGRCRCLSCPRSCRGNTQWLMQHCTFHWHKICRMWPQTSPGACLQSKACKFRRIHWFQDCKDLLPVE